MPFIGFYTQKRMADRSYVLERTETKMTNDNDTPRVHKIEFVEEDIALIWAAILLVAANLHAEGPRLRDIKAMADCKTKADRLNFLASNIRDQMK